MHAVINSKVFCVKSWQINFGPQHTVISSRTARSKMVDILYSGWGFQNKVMSITKPIKRPLLVNSGDHRTRIQCHGQDIKSVVVIKYHS